MTMVAGRRSLVAGETRKPRGYRDLEVYQRSLDALVKVHRLAAKLPGIERFELASQLRRASKSVPVNIAEGYAKRRSSKEFISYLTTALGSANEMEVHLEIAARLGYGEDEARTEIGNEYSVIGRQLVALIRSWQPNHAPATSDQ
jgi:four helix bundle protein